MPYCFFATQELRLCYCKLRFLPAVCSTLTQLTCLECSVYGAMATLSLPSWLTRLTNLRRLECQGSSLWNLPRSLRLDLLNLEHLVSRTCFLASAMERKEWALGVG